MLVKGNPEVIVTLPSDREISFTSTLDYPRRLVFEAWTEPEHIRHWWGCEGSKVTVCEVDPRVGGKWRIVLRMADGSEHPFRGIFREIVKNERLVYSECYEMPVHGNPEWLTTITFEDLGGGTKLTHLVLHRTPEMRDGHLKAGMEAGSIQAIHRLADRVAVLAESCMEER